MGGFGGWGCRAELIKTFWVGVIGGRGQKLLGRGLGGAIFDHFGPPI